MNKIKKNKKVNNNMNSTDNKKADDEKVTKKNEEKVANEAIQNEEPTNKQNAENVDAQSENSADESQNKELEETKKELEDQKDKYLRLSAEFDNYRKRTMKEKAEIIKNGAERTITAILPILDDFERALKNIAPSEETKSLYEGIDLIYNKFLKTLAQQGLEKIETEDKDFDTDYHEAIAMVPAPEEDKKGKILDCVQPGYKLNDKVIRHSKVVVAQ